MKRVLILSAMLLTVFVCQAKKKYDLRYNLEPGQTYYNSINTTMAMKMADMMSMDMSMDMDLSQKVIAKRDTLYDMECRISSIKYNISGMAGQKSIDSSSDTPGGNILDKVGLNELTIKYVMNDKGGVVEMEDADKLLSGLRLSGPEHSQVADQLKGMLGKDGSLLNMSDCPDSPIAVGESWTRNMSAPGVLGLTVTSHYSLTKVSRRYYIVNVVVDTTLPKLGGSTGPDIDCKIFGKITIDRKTGMVEHSYMKTLMDIAIAIKDTTPMSMKMEMNTVVSAKK